MLTRLFARLYLFVFLTCFAQVESHAETFSNPPVIQAAYKALARGDYLSATEILEAGLKTETDPANKDYLSQVLAWYLGYVGEYSNAVTVFNSRLPRSEEAPVDPALKKQFLDSVTFESAVSSVCEVAFSNQILILNENHHHPQHRAFGQKLLPCLKKAGYTHFALEALAFDETDDALNAAGKIRFQKDGYYTVEPQMAKLINLGLQLGFRVVSYEHSTYCDSCDMEQQIDAREEGQANNLVKKIFAKNPGAKVFVFPGFSHALKRPAGSKPTSRWMAARLWEKTGIEPYSIQQISEQYQGNVYYPQPAFLTIHERNNATYPTLVKLTPVWNVIPELFRGILAGREDSSAPGFDAIVVHRRGNNETSRAQWLLATEKSAFVTAPTEDCDVTKSVLIQFYLPEDDFGTTVPRDQVRCLPGSRCEIVGEIGKRKYRIWQNGKVFKQGLVTLKAGRKLKL